MEQIAVLGGNSIIGQHLMQVLFSDSNIKLVNVWNLREKFAFRLTDNNNFDDGRLSSFQGMKQLHSAVHGCDTVFVLHESIDFSLDADKNQLQEDNIEFVSELLEICKQMHVKRLVYLSSVYLQCSTLWPNVGSREADFVEFEKSVPFPDYCKTKNAAEQLLIRCGDAIQIVIARVGPIYGEGDRSSLICDAIYWTKFSSTLPLIGDQGGALQMTYAGNVAEALFQFATKMLIDKTVDKEIVLVHDDTPNKDIYENLKHFFPNDQRKISRMRIPFYLFFICYMMFSMGHWVINKIVDKSSRLEPIPSMSYVYIVFRSWVFLSSFKQRVFFDYNPKYSPDESIRRSRDYYQQLSFKDIEAMSWNVRPF